MEFILEFFAPCNSECPLHFRTVLNKKFTEQLSLYLLHSFASAYYFLWRFVPFWSLGLPESSSNLHLPIPYPEQTYGILPVGFRKVLCFLKHAPVISEDMFKCIIFEFIKLFSYHSFVRFVNRKQTKECLLDCHLL